MLLGCEQKNFAICDNNVIYLERFLNVVEERLEREFAIYSYQNIEDLIAFLKQQEIEILLIAEELSERVAKWEDRIGNLFVLQNHPAVGKQQIFRYQAADHIVTQILQSYADGTSPPPLSAPCVDRKLHFIGIYTPIGRCLQTTFAMTLGQLLAKKHRTLYLNFEGFSGLSRIFHPSPQYNMTDLVYFYDCAREKFIYRLEHMVLQMNELDYVPPFENYQELASIRGEKWREIFSYLEHNSSYEYVILDLSEHMNGLLDILRFCEKVYTITREDGFALAKMEQYEAMLRGLDYTDVLEKTSQKRFPVFRQIPAHIEQFTYGDVADYTKNLLREDWCYDA